MTKMRVTGTLWLQPRILRSKHNGDVYRDWSGVTKALSRQDGASPWPQYHGAVAATFVWHTPQKGVAFLRWLDEGTQVRLEFELDEEGNLISGNWVDRGASREMVMAAQRRWQRFHGRDDDANKDELADHLLNKPGSIPDPREDPRDPLRHMNWLFGSEGTVVGGSLKKGILRFEVIGRAGPRRLDSSRF